MTRARAHLVALYVDEVDGAAHMRAGAMPGHDVAVRPNAALNRRAQLDGKRRVTALGEPEVDGVAGGQVVEVYNRLSAGISGLGVLSLLRRRRGPSRRSGPRRSAADRCVVLHAPS